MILKEKFEDYSETEFLKILDELFDNKNNLNGNEHEELRVLNGKPGFKVS
jgi:hypothetical protein